MKKAALLFVMLFSATATVCPAAGDEKAPPPPSQMSGMPMAPAPAPAQGYSGGAMGNMGGCMGSMGSMQMGSQGMPMVMNPGMSIQTVVQLVTIQDILQSLLDLTAVQGEMLDSKNGAGRDKLAKRLSEIREKIRELQRETRAQITGASGTN